MRRDRSCRETNKSRRDAGNSASDRFHYKAKHILENYADLQKRRDELKKQLSQMMLFTHDDALYILSNGGSPNSGTERVQSSNISNPCEKAVFGADAMQEKMNASIGRREQKELERIEDDLAAVNMTMKLLEGTEPEVANVARQLYVEGKNKKAICSLAGRPYSYYDVQRLSGRAIDWLADYMEAESRFRWEAMMEELQYENENEWQD